MLFFLYLFIKKLCFKPDWLHIRLCRHFIVSNVPYSLNLFECMRHCRFILLYNFLLRFFFILQSAMLRRLLISVILTYELCYASLFLYRQLRVSLKEVKHFVIYNAIVQDTCRMGVWLGWHAG